MRREVYPAPDARASANAETSISAFSDRALNRRFLAEDGLVSEHERVVPVIKHFLEKPEKRNPVATAGMGYHPGETR